MSASNLKISIADAPAGLLEIVTAGNAREKREAGRAPVGTQDHLIYVRRAIDWLEGSAPSAIEGEGGDDTTYRVAAQLKDFGISESMALYLMVERWNETKAFPPWQPEDLETKVANAYTFGTGAPGKSTVEADFGIRLVPVDEQENAEVSNPLADYEIGTPPSREAIAAAASNTEIVARRPLLKFSLRAIADRALRSTVSHIVKGLLPANSLSVVYGDPGVGKSFIVSYLNFCISTGIDFAGHRTDPGLVFYVVAEGVGGFPARAKALIDAMQPEVEPRFVVIPSAVDLYGSDASAEEISELVNEQKAAWGAEPKLIVIDTFARSMGAGDENSNRDVSQYVRRADMIRERTGAAVMLIHHSGKDKAKGARGATALLGAVDTEIEISRSKTGVCELWTTKQRDIELLTTPIRFRLKSIEIGTDNEGHLVTSCVPEYLDENDLEPIPLSPNDERLFDCLKDLAGEDGRQPVATADLKAAYWASIDPEWNPGDIAPPGYSDRSVEAQIKALVEAGWAIRAQKGRYLPA